MAPYRTYSAHLLGKMSRTVELRISTQRHEADLAAFDKLAAVGLTTGCSDMHTYATAPQLRVLANALLDAANDLDAMESEPAREAA